MSAPAVKTLVAAAPQFVDKRELLATDRRETPLPTFVDLIRLAETAPKQREWYVDGLIPRNANVLLSAHGGAGKSLLALHLIVCIAMGLEFFGLPTKRAVVLLLSCEDDTDELHRRLHKVCAALGVNMKDLAGRLYIFDAVGVDAALYGRRAAHTDSGSPIFTAAPDATPTFDWLLDRVKDVAAEVIVIDSVSDAYDAVENDRPQVRRYFTLCLSLIRHCRGCVIHIGHIDKAAARYGAAAAAGQSYSGSTAWNNSVRSRIALTILTDYSEPGEKSEDDGRRMLTVEKTNYGRPGLTIALRYDQEAGVFVQDGEQVPGNMVGAIRDNAERKAILGLLVECERLNKTVSVAERANGNAAVILGEMSGFPKALRTGLGRKRLWSHLRRLTDEKLIESEFFKTPARKTSERWKVTARGRNELTTQ